MTLISTSVSSVHTHTHMHTHVHIHMHVHTHMHAHMHAHTRTCMHAHTHRWKHAHTHIHTDAYTYAHTHIHTHAHTHTHTHMFTNWNCRYLLFHGDSIVIYFPYILSSVTENIISQNSRSYDIKIPCGINYLDSFKWRRKQRRRKKKFLSRCGDTICGRREHTGGEMESAEIKTHGPLPLIEVTSKLWKSSRSLKRAKSGTIWYRSVSAVTL